MTRRFALTCAALAATFALTPAAQAQRGGRSFGGRPTVGVQFGGYYPGSQYGGYYGNPYSGYGTTYPGYYGNPYGAYGSRVNTGIYYQHYGQFGYAQPYGATPGVTQSQYQAPVDTARLTIRLPEGAWLWIDDYQSQQTGPVRVLMTPALQPGTNYNYTIKAQWEERGQQVVQQRTVRFQAGGDVSVDFTQPDPQAISQPGLPIPTSNPPK